MKKSHFFFSFFIILSLAFTACSKNEVKDPHDQFERYEVQEIDIDFPNNVSNENQQLINTSIYSAWLDFYPYGHRISAFSDPYQILGFVPFWTDYSFDIRGRAASKNNIDIWDLYNYDFHFGFYEEDTYNPTFEVKATQGELLHNGKMKFSIEISFKSSEFYGIMVLNSVAKFL